MSDTIETMLSTPDAPTQTSAAPAAPAAAPAQEKSWMDSLDDAFNNMSKSDEEPKDAAKEVIKDEPDAVKADKDGEEPEAKNMTASASTRFKELKSEVKEWKTKFTELEKKLTETPAAQAQPAEIEALKAKVADYEKRTTDYEKELSISRVEATQEYKTAVTEPLNHILGMADALATKYKVDEAALTRAFGETDMDKQSDLLQDLASGFSERDRIGLYRLADDIGVILKRRESIQTNARAAGADAKSREAAATQQQVVERTKAMDAAKADVWKLVESKVGLLKDPVIAEQVRTAAFATDMASAKPDLQAFSALSSALLPHVLKESRAQATKIADLEKTIADFRKTEAKPGGGKTPAAKEALSSGLGFLDAIEASMK